MTKPAVLFIGAGRRVSLIERFLDAGCDVDVMENERPTPAGSIVGDYLADKVEEGITSRYDIVIPCFDRVLLELAEMPQLPSYVISPHFTCLFCTDKRFFEGWMTTHYREYYPCHIFNSKNNIQKPRFGYGSKGIEKNVPFRGMGWELKNDVITQRQIIGKEYSVDTYFTRSGVCLGCSPRERLRVANGEVIDSVIVEQDILVTMTERIGTDLKIIGPACFQWIIEEGTNKPFLFEVNARFGGGVILSMEAGFNMAESILDEYYRGKEPKKYDKPKKLLMRRVNREFFFDA